MEKQDIVTGQAGAYHMSYMLLSTTSSCEALEGRPMMEDCRGEKARLTAEEEFLQLVSIHKWPFSAISASISRRLTSLQDRLCDVPRYGPAQSLDFLDLAKNCTFLTGYKKLFALLSRKRKLQLETDASAHPLLRRSWMGTSYQRFGGRR